MRVKGQIGIKYATNIIKISWTLAHQELTKVTIHSHTTSMIQKKAISDMLIIMVMTLKLILKAWQIFPLKTFLGNILFLLLNKNEPKKEKELQSFIDKVAQQYAGEVIVGESQKLGFQPIKYQQNEDGSNTVVLERWNEKA